MSLLVIGSLNVDTLANVDRLPQPGETIHANRVFKQFGGKGANQAMAACRLGAPVSMLGCVGEDASGAEYVAYLNRAGVDTSYIMPQACPDGTGSAFINVDSQGENTIVVNPGANGMVSPSVLQLASGAFEEASWILMQLEIPRETVVAAGRQAAERGIPVILNPSPFPEDFPWGAFPIHTLIVNASEAALLEESSDQKALGMIENLVITRGGKPTQCHGGGRFVEVKTKAVTPVDTVGAGDAFAGAYAVAMMEKKGIQEALQFANTAGALATQKAGAQASLPLRAEVDAFFG